MCQNPQRDVACPVKFNIRVLLSSLSGLTTWIQESPNLVFLCGWDRVDLIWKLYPAVVRPFSGKALALCLCKAHRALRCSETMRLIPPPNTNRMCVIMCTAVQGDPGPNIVVTVVKYGTSPACLVHSMFPLTATLSDIPVVIVWTDWNDGVLRAETCT